MLNGVLRFSFGNRFLMTTYDGSVEADAES